MPKTKAENAAYAREWRRLNPDYCKEYHKANLELRRSQARAYAATHAEERRLHALSHAPERNEAVKKWQALNPKKYRAHQILRNARRTGEIVRKPCEVCGETKVEAHHEDYSKPLEVNWLCRIHHAEADQRRRQRDSQTQLTNGEN